MSAKTKIEWTDKPTRAGAILRGHVMAVNRFADWEISKAWWQITIKRGLTSAQSRWRGYP